VGSPPGYAIALAFVRNGVDFETLALVTKEELDAESLERPALVRLPDGRWRLYLSCATTGTKHWQVEAAQNYEERTGSPWVPTRRR